ncbi:thiamine-binding protein [Streptomyces sp. NPDC093085]|uniref:thiamine-binding protein n=1 Tax=Streptomyces sp. NPDC093085 TaxID=3155068 RepID=UPI003429026F
MRLRVEFTTEPFDLDEPPAHAVAAREAVEEARLDAVDVGPFGTTAEGGADAVLAAVDTLLRRSLAAGATRISLQVNVAGGGTGSGTGTGSGGAPEGGAVADGGR